MVNFLNKTWFLKKLLSILVLSLLFSGSSFAWEKIPVPDYVNKKTKSPWNFYEDFEDKKIGKLRLKKLRVYRCFYYRSINVDK